MASARRTKRSKASAGAASSEADGTETGSVSELKWLRERVKALEGLVEDNLALTRRIAELESEGGNLPQSKEGGASHGALPDRPPPPIDLSAIIEEQRARAETRPVVLLFGEPPYCAGVGPGLAEMEIRDLIFGMPDDVAVTLLAVKPREAPAYSLSRWSLHDKLNVIETAWPEPEDLARLLSAIAPDIVMNVGPLGSLMEVLRQVPAAPTPTVVFNLLHGELSSSGAGVMDEVLARGDLALVTTQTERQALIEAGYTGDVVLYRRGVDMSRTAVLRSPWRSRPGGRSRPRRPRNRCTDRSPRAVSQRCRHCVFSPRGHGHPHVTAVISCPGRRAHRRYHRCDPRRPERF